jgi:hypothetical protein
MHTVCLSTILAVLVSSGVASVASAGPAATAAIDPKATYLHTNGDPALDAPAIALDTLGVAPGDFIRITRLGKWDNGPQGDIFTSLMGVFSSSATLLPPSQPHRVPGALDVGLDFLTAPTFDGGQATDIPQDFMIADTFDEVVSVCLMVPAGATHIFLSGHDSWYNDNSDPNADYTAQFEVLAPPTPDINVDGNVDGGDLGLLLASWGDCLEGCCDADLNGDGVIDGADLGLLLSEWG